MTNKYPIAPTPELIREWRNEAWRNEAYGNGGLTLNEYIAARAAQWGADQELEECCKWIPELTPWDAEELRAARRPKLKRADA